MGLNADTVDHIDASRSREANKLLALGADGMFPDNAVRNLQNEIDTNKPASPVEGDAFIAVDTQKVYACFSDGTWTLIYP
ncbi:unnamed protein product [marine sediment metagenome]|uniref:Uncharacterized protein n=1 Tax=marine sediment metagenome TaxID=412755 RepID=X1N0X6_9ZZZZ